MVMPQIGRPPSATAEDLEAYREYIEAGGSLGFQEWVKAGKPTATEMGASDAWLARADAWLDSLVETGGISEDEYDLTINDLIDRLNGQGKYEGKRQTVIELPAAVLNDVERYWTGLPVAAQKEAEKEAERASRELQDIISQRMQLPLYAGGTKEQQILVGQRAIRNLQGQLQTAPEYLKKEIRKQILGLEQSVNQIRESINLDALIRTQAEEPRRPEPEILPNTQAFAEKYGMSPGAAALTAERYTSNPEAEEFANVPAETRAEMSRLVGEIGASNEASRVPTPPPFSIPGFEQVGATGPPLWRSWFEQNYPSIIKRFQQKEEPKSPEGWNEFLGKERARLKEEFASRSAFARGERPGAFQPRIKTVAF